MGWGGAAPSGPWVPVPPPVRSEPAQPRYRHSNKPKESLDFSRHNTFIYQVVALWSLEISYCKKCRLVAYKFMRLISIKEPRSNLFDTVLFTRRDASKYTNPPFAGGGGGAGGVKIQTAKFSTFFLKRTDVLPRSPFLDFRKFSRYLLTLFPSGFFTFNPSRGPIWPHR